MNLEEAVILTERNKNLTKARENKNYNKHKNYWKEDDPTFKAGRERIVSAVVNRLASDEYGGIYIDRSTVRKYLIDQFNKWSNEDTKTPSMIKIENKAAEEGYIFGSKTESSQKGRAYMYSCILNNTCSHFKSLHNK